MPNKLKRISGKELIRFSEKCGFSISRQKGSHVNLIRTISEKKQLITIPNHREIDRGTLHCIYRQLSYFIPEKDLRTFFYANDK